MRRFARMLFGLVALACGSVLIASSATTVWADPIQIAAVCPCTDESEAKASCKSGLTTCEGIADSLLCKYGTGIHKVEEFSKECLGEVKDRKCSTPDRNCHIEATCKWDPNATPKCKFDKISGTQWKQVPMPEGGDCTTKGAPCPVVEP
jgi:hypothetical protein